MKKIAASILCLLLVFSLAGCSRKKTASDDFGDVVAIYNEGTRYVFKGHVEYLENGCDTVAGHEFVGATQKTTGDLKADFDSTHDGLIYINRDNADYICLVLGDGSWDSENGKQPVLFLDKE